jgi:hypothetical protein
VHLSRDGMAATPARMARACAELFTLRPFLAAHFPNEEHYEIPQESPPGVGLDR